ncbi:MAG: ABC transporter ATP-binding protein/permease [Verrucomicrobia bacterium]|nr:ABC transporter ATP-binding protein/permease [Verrucomicrobiota bacterium]
MNTTQHILPFQERTFPFWSTLWRYFRNSRGLILGALGLNMVCGMAITAQNAVPKYLTDSVLLADLPPASKIKGAILLMACYLFVALVGRMLCWHFSMRLFARACTRALVRIRTDFFQHVNFLCLRFHEQKPSGELLSYLFGSPLGGVQQFLFQFVLVVPFVMFTLLSTLALVFSWNPILAGILLGGLLLNAWVSPGATKQIRELNQSFQRLESSVSGRASELLRGQKAVKILGAEESVVERFRQDAADIGSKSYEVQVRSHLLGLKSEAIQAVVFSALAVAGTILFVQGRVQLGEIVATLASYASIQPLIGGLFQCALAQGVAHAGLNRIESVLAHRTSTPEAPATEVEIPERPSVELRDMVFAYQGSPVIHGISLKVPYGQKVAFVGHSGCGKSTIVSLMLRLYDPGKGEILLGGIDLRDVSLQTVRRQFGVVPQETFLFHASVRENILLANPDATDGEIVAALERANAWEFVRELPDTIHTVLGEGGATLSGGQRQRIGIARALAQQPAIFIFDEATSALDTASESLITETLTHAMKDNTAFVIAHRLSTVRFCDRVVVFDHGRIVQDGTYSELASNPGPFRDLLDAQNGGLIS